MSGASEHIEMVVLVDENDKELGEMEKLEAHQCGALHRAFSVFVFNTKGEILLQRRAAHKYHSPGLWTNTCCSHPRPNEHVAMAADRRLMEEMGMRTLLKKQFSFQYRASFSNGLIEHELDHVFFGVSDDLPKLNPDETDAFKYMHPHVLRSAIERDPTQFTPWLKICLDQVIEHIDPNPKCA